MSRLLLTGAGGFTGRHLAPRLAAAGHEVHGLAQCLSDEMPKGVHQLHQANLADPISLANVIAEVKPSFVVHLAAIAFVAHGNVEEMYRTNLIGTRHLLEALATSGRDVSMVLLASSANIYGNAREGALDEEVPPSPANDYGVSKLAMEFVARLYADRLPIAVVRPFNYTGVGQSENFLIPKIVAHAKRRAPSIELGNINVARDFSDVRSVAEIYARMLAEPKVIGGTFNVCSGRAITLREVISDVEALTAHSMDVRINPAFVRANEVHTLSGSPALLASLIGPLPSIPLRDTLDWMLSA
jgi:nucleoside-diphosphate-sugar epimerase